MGKILIVGGEGYIGRALQELYHASDHTVTVVDMKLPTRPLPKHTYIVASLETYQDWDIESFDAVYNLAAITNTASLNVMSIDRINRELAIEIAKKSKKYVFASTCNVWAGNRKGRIHHEQDIPLTASAYGGSKRAVEKWLEEEHHNYLICRFGMNYGYTENMRYAPVGNTFMFNALFGKPIKIFGDGRNTRPMIHVRDTARALYYLTHSDEQGVFHVAHENTTLNKLAMRIQEWVPEVKIHHLQSNKVQPSYAVNNEKLMNAGFKFEYGLGLAFGEFKERFKNVKTV